MRPRFSFLIDLPVRTEWANVDLLRTSILNCFAAIFQDVDGCRAFAMVASELLENAIKHGHWKGSDHPLRLRVWGGPQQVSVQVENPIDRHNGRAQEVVRTIARIQAFPSAEAAYRARLLEIAASPGRIGISKLGLARIAYEGSCELEAEIIDGDMLRVTSVMEFGGECARS